MHGHAESCMHAPLVLMNCTNLWHDVFTNRWSLVHVGSCLRDNAVVHVSLYTFSGCDGKAVKLPVQAAGGTLSLTVPKPGKYSVCLPGKARPIANIHAKKVPRPAFQCGPLFHNLCPRAGVGSISAADAQLAQEVGQPPQMIPMPRVCSTADPIRSPVTVHLCCILL